MKFQAVFISEFIPDSFLTPISPHQRWCGSSQNWQTGGTKSKPRSRLSTKPFGVFGVFLRNSRKYGLGALRKTPHGGHPTYWPRSLVRQSAINPTTNNQPTKVLIADDSSRGYFFSIGNNLNILKTYDYYNYRYLNSYKYNKI